MPEKDSTGWELSHWAGSPADLVEAVRLAVAKVTALAPYPEGYDPEDREQRFDAEKAAASRAAETAAKLSISITEHDGYSSELADINELAELPERSFDSITSIAINVGAGPYSAPAVSIRVSRDEGLSVKIHGYERSWTAGLRHQLEEILQPARRLHAPLIRSGLHAWLIGGVASQLALYGPLIVLATISDVQRPTRNAIALGSMAAVLLVMALVWFASSRRFELLRPGQQPRYPRWRTKLLGAVAAVLLGVIATVIAAPLV
jgi:hypothetical protein